MSHREIKGIDDATLVIRFVRSPHGADLHADGAFGTLLVINGYNVIDHADCYDRAQVYTTPACHTLVRIYGYHGSTPFAQMAGKILLQVRKKGNVRKKAGKDIFAKQPARAGADW